MANIGATTAFYKVETSLTRANNEVSKSMERLATGKQNANAGDRSSYVAMADTFRLDYVGTKAGIKGAAVAMGYLETGMRVIDSASALISRLQELAVLGANNTNTVQDNEAINLEAEAIADEFNRLMSTSTYKGKNVFVSAASDQEIAMGGRGSEMSFGIGEISYSDLYSSTARTISGDPNDTESFNLAHLPSDAIVAKSYGAAVSQGDAANGSGVTIEDGKKYVIRGIDATDEIDMTDGVNDANAADVLSNVNSSNITIKDSDGADVTTTLASGNVITASADITLAEINASGIAQDVAAGPTDVEGAALTVDTFGAADTLRMGGTFTVTDSSATTDATFEIVIDNAGAVTSITVTEAGSGYAVDDTITVSDTLLGNGGGAALTFDIATVTAATNRVAASYTVSSGYTTSGSGSGAEFSITVNGSGAVYVQLNDGGSGFVDGETVTISGSDLGAADAADLIITIDGVSDGNVTSVTYAEVLTDENAFKSTETYVIQSLGSSDGDTSTADSDAKIISLAFTDDSGNQLSGTLAVGQKIKMASVGDTIGGTEVTQQHLDAANALIEGMTFTMSTDSLTSDLENIQALLNRARVEAGSQYAALESAVSYTTDLTAQYELGYNMVNDVNFSAETAHLAKNQILQQAATAMLAQANSGQQGLLQLIQG
jgi:flagellin